VAYVFIFENGSCVGMPCPYRECAARDSSVLHCRPLRVQVVPPRRPERDQTLLDDAHEVPVQVHPDGWYLDDVPHDLKDFVERHTEVVQRPG
jgi:hypothetical protein